MPAVRRHRRRGAEEAGGGVHDKRPFHADRSQRGAHAVHHGPQGTFARVTVGLGTVSNIGKGVPRGEILRQGYVMAFPRGIARVAIEYETSGKLLSNDTANDTGITSSHPGW